MLRRTSRPLVDRNEVLRHAVRAVRRARPFHIDGWVVLPEHMHCLWTLPQGDADFSPRIRLIKGAFSKGIDAGERRSGRRRERGIWQRRFWEQTIRDAADYGAHMDYIHSIPANIGSLRARGCGRFRRSGGVWGLRLCPADWDGCGEGATEVGKRSGWEG